MESETEWILASERGERAAPGWAAVLLVATLAGLLASGGCSNPQPPTPGEDPVTAVEYRVVHLMFSRTKVLQDPLR